MTASLIEARDPSYRRLGRSRDGAWIAASGSHVTISVDERGRISLSAGATLTVDEARALADHVLYVANQVAAGFIKPGSSGV